MGVNLDIEQRLSSIENKLASLESILIKNQLAQSTLSTNLTAPEVKKTQDENLRQSSPPATQSASYIKNIQTKVVPQEKESATGSLLGLIGVICFVFAAVYIIKLAIDSGWLTPARQIVLAATLGFSLIGLAFRFKKHDKEYFSYLPAAGIIILYLTVFGAANYYQLISTEIGTVVSVLISVSCLYLYDEFKFNIYQVIATVGAYIMPFFMASEINPTFTQINYVVISITFTLIAISMDLRPVSILSAYLAIAVSSLAGKSVGTDLVAQRTLFVLMHFIIFATGVLFHSIKNKKSLTKQEAISFLPIILFFYAIEYDFIEVLYPSWAPIFSIILAFGLLAFYFIGKTSLKSEKVLVSRNMIFSAAAIMLIHSLYFVSLPDAGKPIVSLIIGGAFVFLKKKIPQDWNLFSSIMKIIVVGIFAWNYFEIIISQFGRSNEINIANGFIYACSLIGFSFFMTNDREQIQLSKLILILAHAISIISIYNLVKEQGSLFVSLAWSFYAIAILSFGYYRKNPLFTKSSIVVLLISALKVLIYDLNNANAGIRVICLLVTGALLYAAGLVFRRVDSWNAPIVK
jgi:uncharacterized membrane protein